MFDHYQGTPEQTRTIRPGLLIAATFGMVAASGLLIWGAIAFLRFMGFRFDIPPIEVTYTPYEDEATLQALDDPPPLGPVPVEEGPVETDEAAQPLD